MKKLLLTLLLLTGGCSMNGETYKTMEPKLDLKEFFTGDIKAWGIIQNWKGEVIQRFDVDMVGTWEGNKGKLEEDFVYYDGKTQKRIWHLTQTSDDKFEGRADDIIDVADGTNYGNAIQFKYQMNLPVDGSTYKLTFDDWMFQMNDGVIINRSYIKKFGFTVAELTLFLQKQDK